MKTRIFTILVAVLAITTVAQAAFTPTLDWITTVASTGNDKAKAVAVDGSGNVFVAGEAAGLLPGSSFYAGAGPHMAVTKLDSTGAVQWSVQFGIAEFVMDSAWGVDTDANGDVYFSGWAYKNDPAWGGPVGTANSEAVIAKLSGVDGSVMWYDRIGHLTGMYQSKGMDIAVNGSDVTVAGRAGDLGVPGYTAGENTFVARYDTTTGVQNMLGQSGSISGGSLTAEAMSMDAAGNTYVTGALSSTGGKVASGYDQGQDLGAHATGGGQTWVQKFDAAGDLVWGNQFASSFGSLKTYDILADDAGNTYVVMMVGFDVVLRRITAAGISDWEIILDSGANDYSEGGLEFDGDGNLLLAGSTRGDLEGDGSVAVEDPFVAQFDPATGALLGVMDFELPAGKYLRPSGADFGIDGSFYMTGFYYGGYDWGIVKVDGFTPIPEPATMSLLAVGGIAALIRRKK